MRRLRATSLLEVIIAMLFLSTTALFCLKLGTQGRKLQKSEGDLALKKTEAVEKIWLEIKNHPESFAVNLTNESLLLTRSGEEFTVELFGSKNSTLTRFYRFHLRSSNWNEDIAYTFFEETAR